jgi:hypothetical protein
MGRVNDAVIEMIKSGAQSAMNKYNGEVWTVLSK